MGGSRESFWAGPALLLYFDFWFFARLGQLLTSTSSSLDVDVVAVSGKFLYARALCVLAFEV